MKKKIKKRIRTEIYIRANRDMHEVIYCGIDFNEFVKYLPQPIENLMIITGGCNVISFETKFEKGLELFEGYKLVRKLAQEDVYRLGDFCFVDYHSPGQISGLSEEQIAQLLYLGHMFKPLNSPFFKALQNNFAYLAHDDGWYCKLYCRDLHDFFTVLCNKIRISVQSFYESGVNEVTVNVMEQILQLAEIGLFLDLNDISNEKGITTIKLYTIGNYDNMDIILNSRDKLKNNASQIHTLEYSEKDWRITRQ
jgi:hypothetical protein